MGALLAVQPLLSPCTAVPGSHVAEQLSQHCGPGSPCAGHQLVALASMRVLGPSRSSVSTLPCPSSAGATRCMSLHPSLLPLAQHSQDAAPCTTCCFPALPTPLVFVRQDVMGRLTGVDSNRLSWGAGSLLRRAGMWQGGAAPCSLLVWEADQDRTDLLGPQDPVQPHGGVQLQLWQRTATECISCMDRWAHSCAAPTSCIWAGTSTAQGALPEDRVPGGCQELPQPGTGQEHCGHTWPCKPTVWATEQPQHAPLPTQPTRCCQSAALCRGTLRLRTEHCWRSEAWYKDKEKANKLYMR